MPTSSMPGSAPPPPGVAEQEILRALDEARARTLALVAMLSDEDVERVHSPIMSPLVWDLGHIAAYEDLWLAHRRGGRSLLRPDLAAAYDAFETPRARRGEIPLLGRAQAIDYLEAVRARTIADLRDRGAGDGARHEMVLRHEQQHTETMLQTIVLARLEGCLDDLATPLPGGTAEPLTGLETVTVPAGPFMLGAPEGRFSYDNERPLHEVDLPAFRIGRAPITNGTWMRFAEGGGYERREWWSDEGWSWKEDHDIRRPGNWSEDGREWSLRGWEPIDPRRPVIHVSWFEADAFARAHGVRLPTEAEWEKAATWDHASGAARAFPWGAQPAGRALANVDQTGGGPAPAGAYPAGAAPCGCLGMIGDVWEWTSSVFTGYPGFEPHPYPEYSEVFFDRGYRVLRGGSWATQARIATPTFRNWDHPQRRQIFAGLRIAADA